MSDEDGKKINKIYRRILRMHMDKGVSKKNKKQGLLNYFNELGWGVVSHELGLRFNSPTVNLGLLQRNSSNFESIGALFI